METRKRVLKEECGSLYWINIERGGRGKRKKGWLLNDDSRTLPTQVLNSTYLSSGRQTAAPQKAHQEVERRKVIRAGWGERHRAVVKISINWLSSVHSKDSLHKSQSAMISHQTLYLLPLYRKCCFLPPYIEHWSWYWYTLVISHLIYFQNASL